MNKYTGKYVVSPIDGKQYCRKNGQFKDHLSQHGYTYQTLFETFNPPSVIKYCECGKKCVFNSHRMEFRQTCGEKECANAITSKTRKERTSEEWNRWKSLYQQTMSKKSDQEIQDLIARRKAQAAASGSYQAAVEKREETCKRLYGVKNVSEQFISDEARVKLENRDWMYNAHVSNKQPLYIIAQQLKVGDRTVGQYLHSHNIPTHQFQQSVWEQEISDLLSSLGINYLRNDKTVLGGKHLDFYLPDHAVAIELCGLYWHSTLQPRIDRAYHYNKWKQCHDRGIKLFTIFEDEWKKKSIVQSIICNAVGHRIGTSLYARNTVIDSNVTPQERAHFLANTHIQGDGKGSVNVGLRSEGILVAVMTLSVSGNQYSIVRYASKNVIGGFTKLLSWVKSNMQWDTIITFADRRWSDGKLYTQSGFVADIALPPDYSYIVSGHRYHKFNFRHARLAKRLNHYDPTLSEWDNCQANGIGRIWDCGKERFVMHNNPNQI